MNVDRYLDRIDFATPATSEHDFDYLSKLHHSHLCSVPFENLSIIGERELSLELDDLFRKIIDRQQGGFCYELNVLFEWLLNELGYETRLISCQMKRDDGGFGPEFDHMAILTDLDGEMYLADVGAGTFSRSLLPMNGTEMQDVEGSFRVTHIGRDTHQVERLIEDTWKPKYQFTTKQREVDDFHEMFTYHQTSPESAFTTRFTCTKATPNGRITLSGTSLTTTENGERTKSDVFTPVERKRIISDRFKIPVAHVPGMSFEYKQE